MGIFDNHDLSECSIGDAHDQLSIAYHLIIDNKRIADEAAKAELKDFYVAGSPPPVTLSPNQLNPSPVRPHPERIAPAVRDRALTSLNKEGEPGRTPVKRAKWHLGIRSQSKPADIMNEVGAYFFCAHPSLPLLELDTLSSMKKLSIKKFSCGQTFQVYRAMKTLDFEWKVINPYHVRVRCKRPNFDGEYTKMSLQLYQVDYKSYLLDFKSLTNEEEPVPVDTNDIVSYQQSTGHHTMEFFEMCASLITQLAR